VFEDGLNQFTLLQFSQCFPVSLLLEIEWRMKDLMPGYMKRRADIIVRIADETLAKKSNSVRPGEFQDINMKGWVQWSSQ